MKKNPFTAENHPHFQLGPKLPLDEINLSPVYRSIALIDFSGALSLSLSLRAVNGLSGFVTGDLEDAMEEVSPAERG